MMFGEYLVKEKIISNAALTDMLKIQTDREKKTGEKILLGDLAVEQGYATKDKIEEEFLKYCDE